MFKVGRCLDKDNSVIVTDGTTKKLFELEPGDLIRDGFGGIVEVTTVFDNGIQPVLRIYLRNGTFFECTANHYWYVFNHEFSNIEWVGTDDLTNYNYSMINQNERNEIVDIIDAGEEKHVFDIEVDSERHAFKVISPNGAVGISHNSSCVTGDVLVAIRQHIDDYDSHIVSTVSMKTLVDMCQTQDVLPMTLSYNLNTKQYEWKRVLAGQMTRQDAVIIRITCGNDSMKCTPDHKILTKNRGWIEARYLDEMDKLVSDNVDSFLGVDNDFKVILEFLKERENVYDISVEDNHNFFANGICVHNCIGIKHE